MWDRLVISIGYKFCSIFYFTIGAHFLAMSKFVGMIPTISLSLNKRVSCIYASYDFYLKIGTGKFEAKVLTNFRWLCDIVSGH